MTDGCSGYDGRFDGLDFKHFSRLIFIVVLPRQAWPWKSNQSVNDTNGINDQAGQLYIIWNFPNRASHVTEELRSFIFAD